MHKRHVLLARACIEQFGTGLAHWLLPMKRLAGDVQLVHVKFYPVDGYGVYMSPLLHSRQKSKT